MNPRIEYAPDPNSLAADIVRANKGSLNGQKPRIYDSSNPSEWRYWDHRAQPQSLKRQPLGERIKWDAVAVLAGFWAVAVLIVGLLWFLGGAIARTWPR